MQSIDGFNPLVDLFIGTSPPCGDTTVAFYQRTDLVFPLNGNSGECTFEVAGNKYNNRYLRTGFNTTEYDVIIGNGLDRGLEIINFLPYLKSRFEDSFFNLY